MNSKKFNELIKTEGLGVSVIKLLMGDITSSIDILKIVKDNCISIPDILFYSNFEAVMEGLTEKKVNAKKVGEKLAQSEYGSKTGMVLLKYVYSFETPQKGKCMAYLMDAVSKDFITPTECMRLCRYIYNLSLNSLLLLKNNVHKKTINTSIDDYPYINELKNNGLMYESSGSGLSFELDAFLLDKYSLSYDDENKYGGYIEKYKGIPDFSDFPQVPVYIISGSEPYMQDVNNMSSISVEGSTLKLG